MFEVKGVWPAMATPLNVDESVDVPAIGRLVDYLVDGGVHGMLVLGSTGEFPAMTEYMRTQVVEAAIKAVNGRIPVTLGCGEPGTMRTIEQIKSAHNYKDFLSALVVAVPYYFPLDQNGIIRHYEAVADASELPIIAYDFPQMTKNGMTVDTVARLAKHPNIIGLKASSGDFFMTQRFVDVTKGENFAVMAGNPAIGLSAYELGAKGGIYAGCSLFPKQCADVYNYFVSGEREKAVELQKKVSLIPMMGSFGPNSAVVKFGLNKLGICGTTVAAPAALNSGNELKILDWMDRIGITV